MLAPTDYEINEAENGEQALVAIAKQRPDLILMDIQLPIMDGYTATRRIKAANSPMATPATRSEALEWTMRAWLCSMAIRNIGNARARAREEFWRARWRILRG
jgi:chemotaxis response regulator CheB